MSQPKPEFVVAVVDNNPEKLERWRQAVVSATGVAPLLAQSEPQARELLLKGVNLVVVDLFLSPQSEQLEREEDSEGLRLIELCRRSNPCSRIIAITSRLGGSAGIGAASLLKGADDFISTEWEEVYADALLKYKVQVFAEVCRQQRTMTP